jgi:3-hydroxyethyl bacteriochlorophyllide a dehydrogenase
MNAQAIVCTATHQVVLDTITIPEPKAGEVVIQTAYSMISPGTELRCLAGQQPNSKPYPYIPGYALSGHIIAVGANTTLALGTPVFCAGTCSADVNLMWGGHVSRAVQLESQVLPIPDGVSMLDAAMTALAGIAYHGRQMSQPLPGDYVAVLGLGVLGQLSARLHAMCSSHVLGIDRIETRVETLQRAGIAAFSDPQGLQSHYQKIGHGADIVVDATGSPGAVDSALALAKALPWNDDPIRGTRILIQGSYPDRLALPYQLAFEKELSVLFPRNLQAIDRQSVLELMRQGQLVVRDLISEVASPVDAQGIYTALRENSAHYLTVAFDWTSVHK